MRSKEGRRPGREGCAMKIKGITQEVTTCDACGRVNMPAKDVLKRAKLRKN